VHVVPEDDAGLRLARARRRGRLPAANHAPARPLLLPHLDSGPESRRCDRAGIAHPGASGDALTSSPAFRYGVENSSRALPVLPSSPRTVRLCRHAVVTGRRGMEEQSRTSATGSTGRMGPITAGRPRRRRVEEPHAREATEVSAVAARELPIRRCRGHPSHWLLAPRGLRRGPPGLVAAAPHQSVLRPCLSTRWRSRAPRATLVVAQSVHGLARCCERRGVRDAVGVLRRLLRRGSPTLVPDMWAVAGGTRVKWADEPPVERSIKSAGSSYCRPEPVAESAEITSVK
jgi:hypothetical protein